MEKTIDKINWRLSAGSKQEERAYDQYTLYIIERQKHVNQRRVRSTYPAVIAILIMAAIVAIMPNFMPYITNWIQWLDVPSALFPAICGMLIGGAMAVIFIHSSEQDEYKVAKKLIGDNAIAIIKRRAAIGVAGYGILSFISAILIAPKMVEAGLMMELALISAVAMLMLGIMAVCGQRYVKAVAYETECIMRDRI